MSSLFDEFAKGVGAAVTDIREKVVEEPFFGRVVTGSDPQASTPEPPAQQPSAWEAQVASVQSTPQQGPEKEPDHDLER